MIVVKLTFCCIFLDGSISLSKLITMKWILFLFAVGYSLFLNAQQTYLHCGEFFNSKTGKLEKNKTIIVENDKILRVENGITQAANNEVIVDLTDQIVMPGWIDMHVHLEGESNPKSYMEKFTLEPETLALKAYSHGKTTLLAGFTTVRDLGGTGANNALRDAINSKIVEGPRIYSVRKSIAITGGHADPTNGSKVKLQGNPTYKDGVCDGPEECAKAVRWQVKNGADWIKITATGGVLSVAKDGDGPAFSDEELQSIIATAKDRGVQVAAHAHGKDGMLRAVKAGVKTIEHGTYMDKEVMQAMKQHDAYYIPTITAGWSVGENAKKDGYYPEVVAKKAARIGPQILKTFKEAYKFGVPIGFGTDAGVFNHGENAKEFELMVEGGMPIEKAIQSATIVNAKLLKAENELGQLNNGFYADIIAVDKNAFTDLSKLIDVNFVMKGGVVYKVDGKVTAVSN